MNEDIIYVFLNILESNNVPINYKEEIVDLFEKYERHGWDIFEQYEVSYRKVN
tara:strand:- start:639 stop:797 length:159 start_codon:yes stop_codon:yes gene_type:complete